MAAAASHTHTRTPSARQTHTAHLNRHPMQQLLTLDRYWMILLPQGVHIMDTKVDTFSDAAMVVLAFAASSFTFTNDWMVSTQ